MGSLKVKVISFVCMVLCLLFTANATVFMNNNTEDSNVLSFSAQAEENIEESTKNEERSNSDKSDPVAIFLAIGFVLVCLFFCIEAIVSFSKKAKKDREKQFSRE